MAVWIEDADGNFVTTLALYHKANGDNWLNTLASWYAASGGTDTTTSGTVPAGTFTACSQSTRTSVRTLTNTGPGDPCRTVPHPATG